MCVLPPTPSFSSKSPSHICGNKEKTHSSINNDNNDTSINHDKHSGEGLPSPSHNVLTNPPEPYKVKAHNGIVESAKKWYIQLDLTSYQPDITTFRYEGANSTRWGNRPNEASTKKHAETMYKQLWNFIMMYGDYDSLLILLSPPPNNVISMTAKSIELFLLYKHQKAGTPLLDPSTQEPVNDIFGKPFVCDGTWRAPDSNKIFNAAIANLHTANNQKRCIS